MESSSKMLRSLSFAVGLLSLGGLSAAWAHGPAWPMPYPPAPGISIQLPPVMVGVPFAPLPPPPPVYWGGGMHHHHHDWHPPHYHHPHRGHHHHHGHWH